MTGDVRTLLHDTAETPSRAPDIGAALRTARDRRRRRRGLGTLVGVVVVALVTGLVALGGGGGDDGDGAQVAIGARQSGSPIPDGWQTIRTDHGISLSVPADWTSQPTNTTPIGEPLLSADDLTPDADSALVACTTGRIPSASPTVAGSGVTVWEFPADAAQVPGTANDTLPVVGRPKTFAGALIRGAPVSGTPCANARYDQVAFGDAGRVFMIRVATVFPSAADEQARMALAAQVLDTLRIEPLPSATTTSVVHDPTISPPSITVPVTTLPPFVPSTSDEQQINDLFVAWLRDHPDDETRAIVEDADALLDSIHQGLAQHTPDDLAKYSGTVSAIRMLDADHAEVQYTLLHDGQVQFGPRTGVAVRIDGRWKVSRATECALLSLGGITCPPE